MTNLAADTIRLPKPYHESPPRQCDGGIIDSNGAWSRAFASFSANNGCPGASAPERYAARNVVAPASVGDDDWGFSFEPPQERALVRGYSQGSSSVNSHGASAKADDKNNYKSDSDNSDKSIAPAGRHSSASWRRQNGTSFCTEFSNPQFKQMMNHKNSNNTISNRASPEATPATGGLGLGDAASPGATPDTGGLGLGDECTCCSNVHASLKEASNEPNVQSRGFSAKGIMKQVQSSELVRGNSPGRHKKLQFNLKSTKILHYKPEEGNTLRPRKRHEAFHERFTSKLGRPPACWTSESIGTHVNSEDYWQKHMNNAIHAIETALHLQTRLRIIAHMPVSSWWPLTGGLPILSGSAGKSRALSDTVRIWDTGATQGMTDAASATRAHLFRHCCCYPNWPRRRQIPTLDFGDPCAGNE